MRSNCKDFEGISDYKTEIVVIVNIHLSWKWELNCIGDIRMFMKENKYMNDWVQEVITSSQFQVKLVVKEKKNTLICIYHGNMSV